MIKCLFILLFAALGIQAQAFCPSAASKYENVDHDLDTNHNAGAQMISFVAFDEDSQHRNAPLDDESGTQIQQAAGTTIQVSLVPAVDASFLLLAVIYGLIHWRVPERANTLAYQPIFNVLFRVIISRNAP